MTDSKPRSRKPQGSFIVAAMVCGCLLAFASWHGPSAAAEQKTIKSAPGKKQPRSNIDDDLLKELDNELLEGAGDLKRPPAKPKDPAAADKGKGVAEPDAAGEDIGQPSEDDPLLHISQEMRSVESLIPEQQKREHAVQLQQRIVEDLVKLIDQAEKQRAQQQASGKNKKQQPSSKRESVQQPKRQPSSKPGKESNKPAQDSTERMGKAENVRPDPEMLRGLMKDSWGHLPAKTREQMLQNSPERFLPQYELMIEKYYKRLAEEQSSK